MQWFLLLYIIMSNYKHKWYIYSWSWNYQINTKWKFCAKHNDGIWSVCYTMIPNALHVRIYFFYILEEVLKCSRNIVTHSCSFLSFINNIPYLTKTGCSQPVYTSMFRLFLPIRRSWDRVASSVEAGWLLKIVTSPHIPTCATTSWQQTAVWQKKKKMSLFGVHFLQRKSPTDCDSFFFFGMLN